MMSFSFKSYFEVLEQLYGNPGCPWSKIQTFSTICQHVTEEVHEALDAHEKGEKDKLEEELGDLLFTVTYLLYIAMKDNDFTFEELVDKGVQKAKRRSPHVFEEPKTLSLEQLREQWQALKEKERKEKNEDALSSVAPTLSVLHKAMKWAELAYQYDYEEALDPNNKADQLLKIVFEASNQHENVAELLETRLKKFELNFREHMQKDSQQESMGEKK